MDLDLDLSGIPQQYRGRVVALAESARAAALAQAVRAGLRETPQPAERTPEVVLRAMLLAYEAAALEAMRTYYQAEDDYDSAEWARFNHLDDCVDELRAETAYLIAGYPGPELTYPILATDYEARLRGERPLDAPPAEADGAS